MILDAPRLWSELGRYPTRRLAEKYNTTRRTLSFKLQEIDEAKYEEIIAKRRTQKPQPPPPIPEETWRRLEDGHSIRQTAIEQNVHPSILHQRIRRHPRYKEIIAKRKENIIHRIREAAREFMEGQVLAKLSKKYGIDPAILRSEIQGIIGEETYQEILLQRRNNPSNKIPIQTIDTAAKLLEQGSKVNAICEEFNIHRKTLRRRLRQELGPKYDEIMAQRRAPQELIQNLGRLFLDGESLNQLSKTYKVPLTTLARRLPRTIGENHYKDIQQKRLLDMTPGTRGAARSKYELEIENLLNKHGIPFTRMILPIDGHKYLPDFIILTDPPIIIEATGMNIDAYWIKYKHKLQHYLDAGYIVICIVYDTSVYNKARKYVPENILIRFKEFKNKIESLEKVPSRNHFSAEISRFRGTLKPVITSSKSDQKWILRSVIALRAKSFIWLNKQWLRNEVVEAGMEKKNDSEIGVPKMQQADMTPYIIRQDKKYYAKGENAFYYYEGLPADIGEKIMTGTPNINPEDTENESPTAKEMIEIAKKHQGHLIGYIVAKPADAARIAVTGFEIKVNDTLARNLKKELAKREIGPDEFIKVRRRKGILWRFWWD